MSDTATGERLDLPCGERVRVRDLDLGLRELDCECGDAHAVVTDAHPPQRFLPDFLVATLREAVETDEGGRPFGTPHLLAMVHEEYPEGVVTADASADGEVGYARLWVTAFDARRLHELVVELVVEMMEHAVSHAEDEAAIREFESSMLEFDVATFVDEYRAERDVDDPRS